MPRSGSIPLANLVVKKVVQDPAGSSVTLAKQDGTITIVVTTAGLFPAGLNLRPNDTVDMRLDYDPR